MAFVLLKLIRTGGQLIDGPTAKRCGAGGSIHRIFLNRWTHVDPVICSNPSKVDTGLSYHDSRIEARSYICVIASQTTSFSGKMVVEMIEQVDSMFPDQFLFFVGVQRGFLSANEPCVGVRMMGAERIHVML